MKSSSKSHRRLYHILAGAVALALPTVALAQGQLDVGRSNDASNRIGSGGRNQAGVGITYGANNYIVNNGNQIITGNVTQGREFHGNVGYSDPTAFRGATAGSISDTFVKNSYGVPSAHAPAPVPNTPTTFYGASQTAAPPPGFQLNANRTGFVPAATAEARGIQDRRMGVIDLNAPMDSAMPAPGEMITRGSLSPQQAAQALGVLVASPLYGVREWNMQDPADREFLQNALNRQTGNITRGGQISPQELQKMRNELAPELNTTPKTSGSFDAPKDPAMGDKNISDSVNNGPIGANGLGTGQGTRLSLMGMHKTNTQYNELNKRLEQYYSDLRKTDADAAAKFNSELRARKEAEAKAALAQKNKNPNEIGTLPKPPVLPDTTPDATKPKVRKPAPLKVPSIAAKTSGEGLSNVMKKAEGLMKQGKFTSALDQYDIAEGVTPENPWIWLGRANAELGAGFFMRADGHLRQALTADKALLLGQYDLTGMLGEDRLGKIVTDLKEIANKEPNKPNAVFLLAYIAYNTGHEREAMGYLDLAEKRAGDQTAFYKMVRDHWALPEEGIKPEGQTKPDKKLDAKPEVKPDANK